MREKNMVQSRIVPILVFVAAALCCWCGIFPPSRRHHFAAHSLSLGGTPVSSSSTTTTTVRSKSRSVPAPAFDVFARSIMGDWHVVETTAKDDGGSTSSVTDASSSSSVSATWTVEEVMRRCGGAVQGVREVPPPSGEDFPVGLDGMFNESTYLNRADDGFVYLDCGSYTVGPTRLDLGCVDGEGRADFATMCSFSFPSRRRRCVVSSLSRPGEGTSLSCVTLGRPGLDVVTVTDAQEDEESIDSRTSGVDVVPDEVLASIVWEEETLCRMSSPTDPWMLPRARWEAYVSGNAGDGERSDSNAAEVIEEDGEGEREVTPRSTAVCVTGADGIISWATILEPERSTRSPILVPDLCSSRELGEFMGVTTTTDDGGFLVTQVGALCTRTGEASAFLRGYDGRRGGGLVGVAFQKGIVVL